MIGLSRRSLLLLPLLVAGCGGEESVPDGFFEPLRYNYLPPIQLNVATVDIVQRFIPAGVPPDVTSKDPAPPIEALKAMANDRLQAFGTANRAEFSIIDATLTQVGDNVHGVMAVSLAILDNDGAQRGYATARVQRDHIGDISNIRQTLYDMTKTMMDDMNVEFEYQIRHNLKDWLTSPTAPDTPVQQAPLDQSDQPPDAPIR